MLSLSSLKLWRKKPSPSLFLLNFRSHVLSSPLRPKRRSCALYQKASFVRRPDIFHFPHENAFQKKRHLYLGVFAVLSAAVGSLMADRRSWSCCSTAQLRIKGKGQQVSQLPKPWHFVISDKPWKKTGFRLINVWTIGWTDQLHSTQSSLREQGILLVFFF